MCYISISRIVIIVELYRTQSGGRTSGRDPPPLLRPHAITGCYHFFEKDAIARWFQYNSTCPQCREPTGVLTVGH